MRLRHVRWIVRIVARNVPMAHPSELDGDRDEASLRTSEGVQMPLNHGRFTTRTPTSIAIAAFLVAACPSLAMQQEADEKPLLSGPSVDDQTELTLVNRNFSGEFQRLDRHPAEAAYQLIRSRYAIAPENAAEIEEALQERRTVLDELVIDRLDLLIKFSNGGNDKDWSEAIAAVRKAMAPLAMKGMLGDRIRRHLPSDAAAEHQRLEREYVRAAVADRIELLRAEARDGEVVRGIGLRAHAIETLVGLGAEVKAAYERTLVQEGERLESLISSLNLSPEQEGKVRQIIGEYTDAALADRKTLENDGARLAVFLRVAAELDADQRRILIEYARGTR
jgi:hypothetical protein